MDLACMSCMANLYAYGKTVASGVTGDTAAAAAASASSSASSPAASSAAAAPPADELPGAWGATRSSDDSWSDPTSVATYESGEPTAGPAAASRRACASSCSSSRTRAWAAPFYTPSPTPRASHQTPCCLSTTCIHARLGSVVDDLRPRHGALLRAARREARGRRIVGHRGRLPRARLGPPRTGSVPCKPHCGRRVVGHISRHAQAIHQRAHGNAQPWLPATPAPRSYSNPRPCQADLQNHMPWKTNTNIMTRCQRNINMPHQ